MRPRLLILALLFSTAIRIAVAEESTKTKAPTTAAVTTSDADQIAVQARHVIQQYCHRCHSGTGSEGGDLDFFKRADLLTKGSAGLAPVVAKEPDQSFLIQRIIRGEMPPAGQPQPRLADVASLWRWIESGAPEFPATEKRTFISLQNVLEAIRDDLRRAPREQRPYLRYFTLHYTANNPELSGDDVRLLRAALSKAVNSLSWKPRIVVPRAIDPAQVVYAIDVRDFDWDRHNRWQKIMEAYPYSVAYQPTREPVLAGLADEINDLSDCRVPLIRADWFVATATRPPLYYTVLELTTDIYALEQQLGIDARTNFLSPQPDRIARAAFEKSGVSGQNRLVERQESKYGAYWKSYDFLVDSQLNQIRRLPLGPLNLFPAGHHPFEKQAFKQDGGEILFNLPNGLQAYLLVNGKDELIDEGPIAVVSDPLKTAGTPAIVDGVSCMACHKQGVVPLKDTIRDHSAVFGDAELHVQRLFPDEKKMDELIERDTTRFNNALEQAIGPFIRNNKDDHRSISELPEPVGDVARQYRLGFLDLTGVARELDFADPQPLLAKVGEKKLKQLGLEALSQRGGVISRLQWQSFNGVSLMQELSRAAERIPVRPF